MIGHERFRLVMLVLGSVMIVNVIFLFNVYNDLLFAVVSPLIYWTGGFLVIVIFGILLFGASRFSDTNYEILYPRALVVGLLPVWMLVGDDLIIQSDNLVKPWFWSGAICMYIGWLMGVASIMRFIIRKREAQSEENRESELSPEEFEV